MMDEYERRKSKREQVEALFRAKPGIWIGIHELAHAGGFSAWRTRVADCRKTFRKEGGDLLWNQDNVESQYMYRPQAALGRDASERVEQKGLF